MKHFVNCSDAVVEALTGLIMCMLSLHYICLFPAMHFVQGMAG